MKLMSSRQFFTNTKEEVSRHESLLKEKVDSLDSSGIFKHLGSHGDSVGR